MVSFLYVYLLLLHLLLGVSSTKTACSTSSNLRLSEEFLCHLCATNTQAVIFNSADFAYTVFMPSDFFSRFVFNLSLFLQFNIYIYIYIHCNALAGWDVRLRLKIRRAIYPPLLYAFMACAGTTLVLTFFNSTKSKRVLIRLCQN